MTTQIFTGNAGSTVLHAAIATARQHAETGRRTLLLSLAPAASLAAALGVEANGEPQSVAPNLDALALDPAAELAALWERGRANAPAALQGIASDELPLLPGADVLLGVARLEQLAPQYEAVVMDAGPHQSLLRALALPDNMRWTVRLLAGLERGPGRNPATVARAALPISFIPFAVRDAVQQARVDAEVARDALLQAQRTSACFVLHPDAAALADAQLAVPALHLHGLRVAQVLCGPLLPADLADQRLAGIAAEQHRVAQHAAAIWDATLLRTFVPGETVPFVEGTGQTVAPVRFAHANETAVVVDLPGLPRGALQLTLSGDELIIRVGPYRRHILLPEGLRGISAIKASREGNLLVVRRR